MPHRGSGRINLRTDTGEELHARFLVDGTGQKSVVANKFGLRPEVSKLRTQSRTIFTHMKGFKGVASSPD